MEGNVPIAGNGQKGFMMAYENASDAEIHLHIFWERIESLHIAI